MSEPSQEARDLLNRNSSAYAAGFKAITSASALAAIQEALNQRDAFKRGSLDNAMWFDALKVDYDAINTKLQEAIRLMGELTHDINAEFLSRFKGTELFAHDGYDDYSTGITVDPVLAIAQFVKENDNGAA